MSFVVLKEAVFDLDVDEALSVGVGFEINAGGGRGAPGTGEGAVFNEEIFCTNDADALAVVVVAGDVFNGDVFTVWLH